jgi:Rieske 2Fe-2S family protein
VAFAPETAHPRLLPTLPGEAYTDPALFAREEQAIFARRWMLVGRSEEIAEAGSFITANVAGESVIVVRRADGEASAFLNVCRHRGARMLLEESGSCGKIIRCPYHSWSYALDGSLQGAPNIREWALGDEKQELALQSVSLEERYGFLFVMLGEGPSFADDIDRQLGERLGETGRIESWGTDRLRIGRRIRYNVAANWKLIVENFMECYHCSTIHPELVDVIPEFKGGLGSQSYGPGYGAQLGPETQGFTVDGRAGAPVIPTIAEDDQRRYYGMTLTPSMLLSLVGDHVIAHRIEPLAADRCRVTCDWLFEPEVLASGYDIGPSVELFDRVNLQDFDACERCQLGSASQAFKGGGVLVPVEHHLDGFYDEVRQALEAHG